MIKKSYVFNSGQRWTSPMYVLQINEGKKIVDGKEYNFIKRFSFYDKKNVRRKYKELLDGGFEASKIIVKRKIKNKWEEVRIVEIQ